MYIIKGKSNCSYCSDLRAKLNKKNIPYAYLDQRYCHADILVYIYIHTYIKKKNLGCNGPGPPSLFWRNHRSRRSTRSEKSVP